MGVYELTDARHGRFLYNRNDLFIGKGLALYGEWSQAEVQLFAQVVRPGDVVVEAGANIGSHTVFLSRQAGDAGRVIAFEPGRLNFQLLCANLALNECFNVEAVQRAVGDAPGTVRFPAIDPHASRNFGDLSVREGEAVARTEEVQLQTIDDLGLQRLDFLKADIEGFEPHMLRGARRTLENQRPVLYLEIDATQLPAGNRDELVGLLEPLGYACYYYVAPMFNPANFRGNPETVFNGAVSLDMVCVPVDKAEVAGLTRAGVQDGAIHIAPGQLRSTTAPWNGARFRYLRQGE